MIIKKQDNSMHAEVQMLPNSKLQIPGIEVPPSETCMSLAKWQNYLAKLHGIVVLRTLAIR